MRVQELYERPYLASVHQLAEAVVPEVAAAAEREVAVARPVAAVASEEGKRKPGASPEARKRNIRNARINLLAVVLVPLRQILAILLLRLQHSRRSLLEMM